MPASELANNEKRIFLAVFCTSTIDTGTPRISLRHWLYIPRYYTDAAYSNMPEFASTRRARTRSCSHLP